MPRDPLLGRLAQSLITPLRPQDVFNLFDPVHSPRQLRGVVTSVSRPTPDSATITFRPGKGWHPHEAGQWARIGVDVDGVRQWRTYSLSASEGADPEITVTDIGLVSGTLVRRTQPGDVLFLDTPDGDFVLPSETRPLLMLTAGSGLSPVMSMIRTLVPRRADADVVLVHSCRSRENSLFHEELDELADQFPGLRTHRRFTGEQGRLDLSTSADIEALCPDWRRRAAYACGPAAFLDDAEALFDREADGGLRMERFSVDLAGGVAGAGGLVTFEGSDLEVEADGDVPLLEVAEEAGVDAPSGCRMGICHACLTPLRSGQVTDLRTGEVHGEPGDLVQTCVSAAAGPVGLSL